MKTKQLIVRDLGKREYGPIWEAMRQFTQQRDATQADEIWHLQHPPVYTQGQAGKPEHLLHPTQIPLIQTDRGGQITYHGPGQLVVYTLLDLTRLNISIRGLVSALEQSVIALLADYQIEANSRADAPGVYVGEAKICSIGLRVKRHCSYHGIAFNINMDLSPFTDINPCGYKNLPVIQLSHFVHNITPQTVAPQLIHHIAFKLGYNADQLCFTPCDDQATKRHSANLE